MINDFSNLFQPFFMAVFVWSSLGICTTLLMVQLEIVEWRIYLWIFQNSFLNYNHFHVTFPFHFHSQNEVELVMLVIIFFNSCYALGLIFVVCELCQRVCDGFEEVNRTMDQLYWLSYPIEIRRMLTIILVFAQQPVQFQVFGSIACCRDSFKRVSSISQWLAR